ncbi:MAG: hypothetical protein Q9212_002800 [Teloschistes hypoglaucus]
MATPSINGAATITSLGSMITINLFDIPGGACSLALAIAGLQSDGGDVPQQTATSTLVAQPVSNPDIAGIGVLVAFLTIAYGIFLWMLLAYVCRLLPASFLGQVDVFVFKGSARTRTCAPWWQNAVDQAILTYADLQIATGVAILVAACSTIRSLSLYHLQVAIYLAWMSSNTHLTAVSLLQVDFRENRNKSIARRLRLGGMAFLGVFLLIALVPTTSYNWLYIITESKGRGHVIGRSHSTTLSPAGIPARCFWDPRYSGKRTADAAWSFIILVLSYVWKGLLLFQRSQEVVKVLCRHWKAEKDHQDDEERNQTSSIALLDGASSQNPDRTSSAIQMATEDDSKPAEDGPSTAAESAQSTPDPSGIVAEDNNENRGTPHLPPWHDEPRIYASRFIIAAFWGSHTAWYPCLGNVHRPLPWPFSPSWYRRPKQHRG